MFSRTESHNWGALSQLDEFRLNPLNCHHSGSQNTHGTNQGTNEDDSQNHPYPEASISQNQTTQKSSPEDGYDVVSGAEKVTYCSGTARTYRQGENSQCKSTAIAQWEHLCDDRRGSHFVGFSTIGKQQFSKIQKHYSPNLEVAEVTNLNNAHVWWEIREVWAVWRPFPNKPQKSKPADWKRQSYSSNFFLFVRIDGVQTFRNIKSPTRENLGEILAVFRRKYAKAQSRANAKHKFHKIFSIAANQKLGYFLDETQKLANDAFGKAAHAIKQHLIYAKMPPHLIKPINQAHLQNDTYEQGVTHIEK